MNISYFKTQWFRLLVAFVCLVMCCVYTFSPAPDTSTIDGLNEVISNMITAGIYFLGFLIWMVMSYISYLQDCIELLCAEKERNDQMYELVQELVNANKIDRKIMKKYEERLKNLEVKK